MLPFDCVGTPDEVVAGLWLLSENPLWREALAVRYYRDELAVQFPDPRGAYARCLAWSDDHELSPAWLKVLRDYTDSRTF